MVLAIENVTLRGKVVLVKAMEFGNRTTAGGFIIKNDDMTVEGARPRWAEVLATGPEVMDFKKGQFVLIEHSRWTRGWDMLENNEKITVRMIDNNDALLIADSSTIEYQQAEKL